LPMNTHKSYIINSKNQLISFFYRETGQGLHDSSWIVRTWCVTKERTNMRLEKRL
jgi:hypothetical protein